MNTKISPLTSREKFEKSLVGGILFLTLLTFLTLPSCQNPEKEIQPTLSEILEPTNALLSELAEPAQKLTAPSNEKTDVTGQKGTIIHLDPEKLETVDGSPMGEHIDIELVEMTSVYDLLTNNAPTVSNGQLLETGGSYYLNMTSNDVQLKVKQDKALEVEFPKLTDDEMAVFLGERDSLERINWVQSEQDFETKNLVKPKKPNQATPKKQKSNAPDLENLYAFMANQTEDFVPTDSASLKEYREMMIKYNQEAKTYKSIDVLEFGLINCDKFVREEKELVHLRLRLDSSTTAGTRFFAVFKNINSMMSQSFYGQTQENFGFFGIPIGEEITIIGIGAEGENAYYFEREITIPEKDATISPNFQLSSAEEISERLQQLKNS